MVGDFMDKDKVYAICGDKNWQETMTKQQIESAINTSANTIESNIEIKTYSSYDQVPNCQGVGDMRTVAQNMAKPGMLVKYINDKNLPGGGNGILTIRTNTTTNTAMFMFEAIDSQKTYICHFFAPDGSNWIKTGMTWNEVALDDDVQTLENKISTLENKISTLDNITSNLGNKCNALQAQINKLS